MNKKLLIIISVLALVILGAALWRFLVTRSVDRASSLPTPEQIESLDNNSASTTPPDFDLEPDYGAEMFPNDADRDGLSDEEEARLGTSSSSSDTDNDGIPDVNEQLFGTNPLKADTDGDGYVDGLEIYGGYNPLGSGTCAKPSCFVN